MAVLYRKYRPQTFGEVIGQKYIIRTLKNQVKAGQVAHAYLFTGSRGVGKTTLARLMAKAINCTKMKDGEACNKCDNCKAIAAGNFLDLVEIDAASNTGVDNIRDLIEHVKFSPSIGTYKVFIIDEVHMLSKGAFNALLKTLEEPPRHAVFVLATTEINKVPATIISRTQRFDFKRLDSAELAEHLQSIIKSEKIKLPKEVISLIADNAEGSGRDALSLLDKVMTLGDGATEAECRQLLGITDFTLCHRLLNLILQGSSAEIPAFFDELMEQGADFAVFNRDFLEYLRKVLIYQVSGQSGELSGDHADMVKTQAGQTTAQELIYITRLFLKSYKDLSASPRAEIPLLLSALEAAQRRTSSVNTKSVPPAVKQPAVTIKNSAPEAAEPVVLSVTTDEPMRPVAATVDEGAEEISLVEVRIWWPKVLDGVKKQNAALANLMKSASLEDTVGNAVVLGVKFPFHKQNLENQKNQTLIRQVLEQVSGKKLAVKAQVVRPDVAPTPQVNLTDALQVFGGELVE